MCDDSEDDHDLRHEGEQVLKEIAPHVKAAESSAYLESSYTVTHLNIKTKEDAALCVRLTVRGYEVCHCNHDKHNKCITLYILHIIGDSQHLANLL